jgi:hypothetical protein
MEAKMNKSHTPRFDQKYPSGFDIPKDQETHVRLFAAKIGEQVGHTITDLVAEMMALLLAGKPSAATQSPALDNLSRYRLLTADEVASFLNISKAKAYRMMQTEKYPLSGWEEQLACEHKIWKLLSRSMSSN